MSEFNMEDFGYDFLDDVTDLQDHSEEHFDQPNNYAQVFSNDVPETDSNAILYSFVDSLGVPIDPAENLMFSGNFKIADFKSWIASAWSIAISDISKGESNGGRKWQGIVESLQKTIIIRKYKMDTDGTLYWMVTYVGDMVEEIPEVKRRKMGHYSVDSSISSMGIESSVSSVGSDHKHPVYAALMEAAAFVPPPPAPAAPVVEKRPVIPTSKSDVIGTAQYLLRQLTNDCPETAFLHSVAAAANFKPRFQPYRSHSTPTPYSEYVDYCSGEAVIEESTRDEQDISWSYRLALYQLQRYFVEFIEDSHLQRRLMKTQSIDMPNNYNPLMCIDNEVMKEVEAKLSTYSEDKRSKFMKKAIANMEYHLSHGLLNKDHLNL